MISSLPRKVQAQSPFSVGRVVFKELPTTLMDSEYYFDLDHGMLKIHLYLRPQVDLRKVWEILAESFGHENLKWSKEIPHTFEDGTEIRGSIFIGLKVTFDKMFHALNRIVEIDRNLLMAK